MIREGISTRSLRINIGSSFVAEGAFSAALQQCLSQYLCLPSPPPLGPCCSPSCQDPNTWDELVTPQPSAHLCPQPSALPPPGCSSNESWSCRKDLHSPCGIPEHKHPRGAEGTWSLCSGTRALCGSAPACPGGTLLCHQRPTAALSSSCSVCAGMTLPDLSTTCVSNSCLPGFGLTGTPQTRLSFTGTIITVFISP